MVDLLRKIGSFMIMFFFGVNYCYGEIRISNDRVTVYDTTTITISGDYKDADILFDYPKEAFSLTKSGESVQNSISIINGKMIKKNFRSLNYSLISKREGTYNIAIKAGDEKKNVEISVVGNVKREDIFIEVVLNEKELYPGLEGKIEYYLYVQPGIFLEELLNKAAPSGKDVLINWLQVKKDNYKREKVNKDGIEYFKYKVMEGYVSSYQEKSFDISPLVLEVIIGQKDKTSDSLFDLFLGVEQKKIIVQSQKVSFSTKSFPTPIPNNFLKILSEQNLESDFSVSSNSIEENQQVSANFMIKEGSYKGIINFDVLQKIIFEDCYEKILFASNKNEVINQNILTSWNMSSLSNCSLEEKNIEFFYFNPQLKEYQKLSILRPALFVKKIAATIEAVEKEVTTSSYNKFSVYFNRFINFLHKALLISFFSLGLFFSIKLIFFRKKEKYKILVANFLKESNYKNFLLIMLFLSKDKPIDTVFLDFEHKAYFLDLKNMLFSFRDNDKKKIFFKKNRKAFKELTKKMKLL